MMLERCQWLVLVVAMSVVMTGCTAGAPSGQRPSAESTATTQAVAVVPTKAVATLTVEPTATVKRATRTATARAVATETAAPEPSRTPRPTATSRPAPPETDGTTIVVERGTSGRREIALTFDAGAERGDAEKMLDILTEYGVVGSFGVSGEWAEANPDLMERVLIDGHMIFNHTWSHQSWTGQSTSSDPEDPSTWKPLTREERLDELARADAMIRELLGYEMKPYFRPPYADYDQSVLDDLARGGYPVMVMWSCESLAWMGWTADQVVDYCTTDMSPGDIILLHVTDKGIDSEALPGLIEGLEAQGFSFVTVEQLLQP